VALVPGQNLASYLHPPCHLLISTSLNITDLILRPVVGTDVYASVLWDERNSIANKSLSSSSYKELKNEEALATKDTMSVLSLQQSNIEHPEETTQLCSSLHVGLHHAIALSCKRSP
jgi:Flp pilus assembly protein TadB